LQTRTIPLTGFEWGRPRGCGTPAAADFSREVFAIPGGMM